MTFLEKQTNPEYPMHWRGDMQADYLYTNGAAGDRFFTNLKKKGTFLACKCPECNKVFLPPRMYCEDCTSKSLHMIIINWYFAWRERC